MADLEARVKLGDDEVSWRMTLPNHPIKLGRERESVDFVTHIRDQFISRFQATLHWTGGLLRVTRQPKATNFIYRLTDAPPPHHKQRDDDFQIRPGEAFAIGEHVFTLHDGPEIDTSMQFEEPRAGEFTIGVPSGDTDPRVQAMSELLRIVRRETPGEAELDQFVVDALLAGFPFADAAALFHLGPVGMDGLPAVRLRVGKRRMRGGVERPIVVSRRMAEQAVRMLSPVHHAWGRGGAKGDPTFTVADAELEWAMCVPVPALDDCGLYVGGRLQPGQSGVVGPEAERRALTDIRFAELLADTHGALRQMVFLRSRQERLTRFLPQPIVNRLAHFSGDVDDFLQARETPVTVLFCDLRGSCAIAERGQHDLPGLLATIDAALSIMTRQIVGRGGVIGDFQGDAAMAFWGWPPPDDGKPEALIREAIAATRAIQDDFRRESAAGGRLEGFACGIGLAHGLGLAGRLGTREQYKIGVFGPVVNRAARLESCTKFFRASILVDPAVAAFAQQREMLGVCGVRRVAKVRLAGFAEPLEVSEILPPQGAPEALAPARVTTYHAALTAFQRAEAWPQARKLLAQLPDDGPADVLKEFIDRHEGKPPPGWDGVLAVAK